MDTATVHVAQATFSQLLARVEAGEEIIVARGKEPIAKIVPFRTAPSERRFGAMRGLIHLDDACFDPLPDDALAAWDQGF